MSAIVTAGYPTTVWNGETATRGVQSEELHRSPTAEDYNRLVAELKAVQALVQTAFASTRLLLSDLKFYVGDGVNSSGGSDVDATFTGAVVGERVLAVIGQTKAVDGNAQAAANSFFKLTPVTDFAIVVATTNKIAFKSGLADKSAITYFAICAPAAVTAA